MYMYVIVYWTSLISLDPNTTKKDWVDLPSSTDELPEETLDDWAMSWGCDRVFGSRVFGGLWMTSGDTGSGEVTWTAPSCSIAIAASWSSFTTWSFCSMEGRGVDVTQKHYLQCMIKFEQNCCTDAYRLTNNNRLGVKYIDQYTCTLEKWNV